MVRRRKKAEAAETLKATPGATAEDDWEGEKTDPTPYTPIAEEMEELLRRHAR